jgi:putative ABC transport system permease protein
VRRLAFSVATAVYRRAVRRVAPLLPPGSQDEQVAVFDELQRGAYAEHGWRALGRYWVAEFAAVTRQMFQDAPSNSADGHHAGWRAWLSSGRRDLRDAFRSLSHSRAYSGIVIGMFALGIGANTAVFSLVDAFLFKALPYARADRLVLVAEWPRTGPGGNWTVAPTMFARWHDATRTLTGLEASVTQQYAFVDRGQADEVSGARVTMGYFDLLGVTGVRGRTFDPADRLAGGGCVAVVTDRFWTRHLGADPAAIGQPLHLSGQLCTLIGVLPADSVFDRGAAEVFVPLVFSSEEAHSESRTLTVLGRLRDGVTVRQAGAELAGLAAAYNATRGSAGVNWTATAFSWRDILVRTDARQLVWILFAAVAVVLIIACANVAGLSLSRTIVRRREIAVRAALGAGRGHLIQALVTESLVLSLAGGLAALLVGSVALRTLLALVPPGVLPAELSPHLDIRALVFTTAASVLTGLLSGLLPAWQAGRVTLTEALATTGRGFSASRTSSRAQSALLVAELALAMVLVTESGLLAMSLVRLGDVQPGFDSSRVLTLRLSAPAGRYPSDLEVAAFFAKARSAIRAMPNVESVGAVTSLPLGGWLYGSPFVILGEPVRDLPEYVHLQSVTAGYFEALHIPLTAGRAFTDADDARAPRVAIVNETLVRRFIPDGRTVGRFLTLSPPGAAGEPSWQIVGVLHDVKTRGLADQDLATPEVYVPQAQAPMRVMFLAIRSSGAVPMQLMPDIRAAIRAIDPDLPVGDVMTMDDRIDVSLRAQRFRTSIIAGFAALAALLACLGAYSVRSRAVAARLRELGIRAALGATSGQIVRLALAQGLAVAAVGLGIGLVASWTLSGYLRAWLFATRANDPAIIVAAVACLGGAAALASWLPARRAGAVDPLSVLRDS